MTAGRGSAAAADLCPWRRTRTGAGAAPEPHPAVAAGLRLGAVAIGATGADRRALFSTRNALGGDTRASASAT